MKQEHEDLYQYWLATLGSIAATLLLVLLAFGVGAVGVALAAYAQSALGIALVVSGKQINLIGSTLNGGVYMIIGMTAGAISGWLVTRRRSRTP